MLSKFSSQILTPTSFFLPRSTGGLPHSATTDILRKYFSQFGNITDAVVMYDAESSRPRGFGFVTFDTEAAADKVLFLLFFVVPLFMYGVYVSRLLSLVLFPVY